VLGAEFILLKPVIDAKEMDHGQECSLSWRSPAIPMAGNVNRGLTFDIMPRRGTAICVAY
jgi:hypothetical protein